MPPRSSRPRVEELENRVVPSNVPVKIVIPELIQIRNPDDSFFAGDGDYYAVIQVGSNPEQSSFDRQAAGNDIYPNWTFTEFVPEDGGPVPITIRIMDDDDFLNGDDDPVDINPAAGENSFTFWFDPRGGRVSDTTQGNGDVDGVAWISYQAYTAPVRVKVEIPELTALGDPDGFLAGDGDYYALIRVGPNPAQSTEPFNRSVAEGETIYPRGMGGTGIFTVVDYVDPSQGPVDVEIAIYDSDDFLEGDDDVIDINPDPGQTSVRFTIDPSEALYPDEVWVPPTETQGNGDGDADASIWYQATARQTPSPYRDTVAFLVNGFDGAAIPPNVLSYLQSIGADVQVANWNQVYGMGRPGPGGLLELGLPDPGTNEQFISDLVKIIDQYDDSDTIVLIGHSFGGDAVLQAANRASREIDLLGLIDPVAGGSDFPFGGDLGYRAYAPVPANVRYLYNRWQYSSGFPPINFLASGELDSSARASTLADFGIRDQAADSAYGHGNMPLNPTIQEELGRIVRGLTYPRILADSGGVLSVRGLNPDRNDALSVRRQGNNVVVTVNGVEAEFPASAVTSIQVPGGGGADTLTLDFSGGNPIPAGGLFYDGGFDPGVVDTLVLRGGRVGTVVYTGRTTTSGTVTVDGRVVTYTGLDPIIDTTEAADRVFVDDTGAGQRIRVADDGTPNDGVSVIDSDGTAAFESVAFAAPTNSLSVQAGDGDDTVLLGVLDAAFAAAVSLEGGTGANALAAAAGVEWVVSGADSGTAGGSVYASFRDLVGGAGPDRFRMLPGGSVSGNIDGRGGADSLDYSAYPGGVTVNLQTSKGPNIGGTFSGIDDFVGGGGPSTLIGPNAPSAWVVGGPDAGSVGGQTFSAFGNLTGGSADDEFAFRTGGSLSGRLDGGGGRNGLTYAEYAGDVTVNLGVGFATGVAGGVARVRDATGGQGDSVLVGDRSRNRLTGGLGRNLVLGAAGVDELYAGVRDSILVSDPTPHDRNLVALAAVMAEWARGDLGARARLDHLFTRTRQENGRLNGPYFLSTKIIRPQIEPGQQVGPVEHGISVFGGG